MPLSTFLNGRSPSQLRGAAWLSLSDSGNVLTGTATSESGGGATQSWVAGTALACRIDPLNGREIMVGGRISDRSTHKVTVAAGVPVTANNRFAISGRGTFEITAVRLQTDEWTRVLEVVEAS